MSYDGSGGTLYLNGAVEGTDASGLVLTSTATIEIGGPIGGTQAWNGSIADVRIYSTALGATEAGILASKIGVDNTVVQAVDTRVGHWMLTVKDSGSLLTAGQTDAETSIEVDDGTHFTTTGEQHILIEDEVMVISSISTNTLTVAARSGANLCGTAAATRRV